MDFKKEVTRICCDMHEVQQEFANHIKELYEIAKEKNCFNFGWLGGEVTEENEDDFNAHMDEYCIGFNCVEEHENIAGEIISFALTDEATIEVTSCKKWDGWNDVTYLYNTNFHFNIFDPEHLSYLPSLLELINKGLEINE